MSSKYKVSTLCLETRLKSSGTRLLADPPHDLSQLLSLLNYLRFSLGQVDQQPSKRILDALKPTIRALIDNRFFSHANVDVRVAVASCIVELMRITAPNGPYNDERMKLVFQLIVSSIENLSDISSQSFKKRASLLYTVAKFRSCVLMLDLECDVLILEMVRHFLNEIRDHHPYHLFLSMKSIILTLFEESDDISQELLSLLLAIMKRNNEEVQPMAVILVEHVLQETANMIKNELIQAVKASGLSVDDYNEVIAGICQEKPCTVKRHQPNVATASKQQMVTGLSNGEATGKPSTSRKPTKMSDVFHKHKENAKQEKNSGTTLEKEVTSSPHKDPSAGIALPARNDDRSSAQISSFKVTENQSENFGSFLSNTDLLHEMPFRKARRAKKKEHMIRHPVHASAEFEKVSEAAAIDPEWTYKGSNVKVASIVTGEEWPFSVKLSDKESGKSDAEITIKETEIEMNESSAQISLLKIVENQTNVGSLLPNENLLHERSSRKVGRPKKKEYLKRSPEHANEEYKKVSEAASDLKREMQRGCNGEATLIVSDYDQPLTAKMPNKDCGLGDADITFEEIATKKDPTRSSAIKEMLLSPKSSKKSCKAVHQKEETSRMNLKRKWTIDGDRVSNIRRYGADLIHHRIQVWWPKDRMFYRGIVGSYYPVHDKHKVLYDDGDVEVLHMRNEIWDFVENSDSNEEEAADPTAYDPSTKMPTAKKVRRVSSSGTSTRNRLRGVSSGRKKSAAVKTDYEAGCVDTLKARSPCELQDKSSKKSSKAGYWKGEISGTKNKRKLMRVGHRVSMLNKYGVDLVHSRIKVWWPLDRAFYRGVVRSYYPVCNKHKVLYDDGDVEILCLKNERWYFVIDNESDEEEAADPLDFDASSRMLAEKRVRRVSTSGTSSRNKQGRVSSTKAKSAATKFCYEAGAGDDLKGKFSLNSKDVCMVNNYGVNLVHRRIKVWWPLDQVYYKAIVESYEPSKNKHRIIYDDGDVEVLSLKKETWKLVYSDSESNEG